MSGQVGVRSSAARLRVVASVCAVLAVLGVMTSTSLGETRIGFGAVAQTLLGQGDGTWDLVVLELRLPRVLAGLLVGAALGLSGAVLQSVSRNPLASPDILGINAGASVAAVSVVILAGTNGGVSGAAASLGLPLAATVGALVSGTLLYALAFRGRRLDPMRLVLVGVGLSAAGSSLVAWLLTIGDVYQVGSAVTWLAGSVHAATWPRTAVLALVLALVLAPLLVLARRLEPLALGDDLAAGLGLAVDSSRILLLLAATVLAGAATATAGAVAFVALAAPQLAQRSARAPHPPLMTSAVLGAAVLVWADLLARQGMSWLGLGVVELPVGLLTAVLGAPYLFFLVVRSRPVARKAG